MHLSINAAGKVAIYNLNIPESDSTIIQSKHLNHIVEERYVVITKEPGIDPKNNLAAVATGKSNGNKVYFVIKKVSNSVNV